MGELETPRRATRRHPPRRPGATPGRRVRARWHAVAPRLLRGDRERGAAPGARRVGRRAGRLRRMVVWRGDAARLRSRPPPPRALYDAHRAPGVLGAPEPRPPGRRGARVSEDHPIVRPWGDY